MFGATHHSLLLSTHFVAVEYRFAPPLIGPGQENPGMDAMTNMRTSRIRHFTRITFLTCRKFAMPCLARTLSLNPRARVENFASDESERESPPWTWQGW